MEIKEILERTRHMAVDAGEALATYGRLPIKVHSYDLVVSRGKRSTKSVIVRFEVTPIGKEKSEMVKEVIDGRGSINAIDSAIARVMSGHFGEDLARCVKPIAFDVNGDFENGASGTSVPARVRVGFRGTLPISLCGSEKMSERVICWHAVAKDDDTIDAAMRAFVLGYNFWLVVNSPQETYFGNSPSVQELRS